MHFSAFVLFTSVSAAPLKRLKDYVGENAASQDVVTLSCNDTGFYKQNSTGHLLLSDYGHYGWGTLICDSECTDTTLTKGGCWKTGANAQNKMCVVAKQAGIPAGKRFAYQLLPYLKPDYPGCEENGVTGGEVKNKGYNIRIVPQAQIGDNSGLNMTAKAPEFGTGLQLNNGVVVIDNCSWGPYNSDDYDKTNFGEYSSANSFFELQCSVECSQSDVFVVNPSRRRRDGNAAVGCPDNAVNKHMPFCLAASMLEIPLMTPFVINFARGSSDIFKNLTGCTRNSIATESGNNDEDNWWRVAAGSYEVTTTAAPETASAGRIRESQLLVFLSLCAAFARLGQGLA